jgi:hypothetical protein
MEAAALSPHLLVYALWLPLQRRRRRRRATARWRIPAGPAVHPKCMKTNIEVDTMVSGGCAVCLKLHGLVRSDLIKEDFCAHWDHVLLQAAYVGLNPSN